MKPKQKIMFWTFCLWVFFMMGFWGFLWQSYSQLIIAVIGFMICFYWWHKAVKKYWK